jgi:uncharacterized protein (TIGR02284 family)
MTNKELVALLQNLIEISTDGERGFDVAANHARDPQLNALLRRYSKECAIGARELQKVIGTCGAAPRARGSVVGALHRRWMNLKQSVGEPSERALLEACERGEDHAKSHFAHALTEKLPPDVRGLVQRLYEGTLRHHDRVRELRDEARRKAVTGAAQRVTDSRAG